QLWYEGDDNSFRIIYERHYTQLLAIGLQKTGNRDIAQELVQDTFMKLYQCKNRIIEITSIRAYLYVILKNKILNHHRTELGYKKYLSYISNYINHSDNSTMNKLETRELERQLNLEIENLPPQCQKVFKLSRKEYLSNKEIAIVLGISENTVEQHMRKALRNLRRSLGSFIEITAIVYLLDK
ncbi:MAG TPA: RNA polymerase sigma-70 factor, partial [Sphingobacteriaceae bacterium]